MVARRGAVALMAVAIVGSLVLAGTGGAGALVGAKPQPLTKKAFIKEADKICRQGSTLASDIADRYLGDLGPDETPDEATLEALMEEVGPLVQQVIDSIRAMKEPKADKKKITKLLDAWQEGLDEVVEDPSLLFTGDVFATSNRLAHAYGFKQCGS